MFDIPTHKIVVSYKSRRSNKYELCARITIEQTRQFTENLEQFKRVFDEDIKKHKKQSIGTVDMFYKCEFNIKTNKLEVWHLTSIGDKDRLLCEINSVKI